LKKAVILPVAADGLDCVSSKMLPQPPSSFSTLVAFVSPVSVKKKSRKCEPGRNTPFSGRLNGVPCAAFASVFALNGAVPSTAVSWIVIHFVLNTLPNECSATWSGAWSAVCASTVIGFPAAFDTCRTCSFPLDRSFACVGTKR